MFKKSICSTKPTLFEGVSQHLKGKRLSGLEDLNAWQNCFYSEITSKVPEEVLSPLYHTDFGRANAPIRILIGMIILKEGNDWTDEQLFEACDYNLLVHRALGFTNLSDQSPSPATYYNFKLALFHYEKDTGINLLEPVFQSITKGQIFHYKVSGKNVRMDSKLTHANLAKTTRLQMALGVIIKFYKSLSKENKALLGTEEKELLEDIIGKSPEQYSYQFNKETAAEQLIKIGELVFKLCTLYKDLQSEEYTILSRLWNEHFELVESEDEADKTPKPKDMSKQGGTPLQSAHDPQATYRNKPGSKKQQITGYVTNIAETCAEKEEGQPGPLNLITDVQTETATTSDDKFLESSLERTREVLSNKIENVLTDGAYNSEYNENLSRQEKESFNLLVTAIQGIQCEYEFEKLEDGNYKVFDPRNGVEQTTTKTPSGKYRIDEHHRPYKYRYLEEKTIINYFRRKEMEDYPKWVYGLRANSESTIHQMYCKLNGMKTKYRGKFKHQYYAICRAMWVNFKRINAHLLGFIEKQIKSNNTITGRVMVAHTMILSLLIFNINFDKI